MKNLQQYIEEKLIVNKDYNIHKYHPTTWDELRQIIKERYKKQGSGTEQDPVDLNDIDVSKMTEFGMKSRNGTYHGIFENTRFEYIDVSDWNVSNVTDMSAMFADCVNLQELDLSNWDMSNVTNFVYMFSTCKSLKTLKLPTNIENNINNDSDYYVFAMFNNCDKKIIPDWYTNRHNWH